MSEEEARSILIDEVEPLNLESGSDEERAARYQALTPRQKAAMELDRWCSTGGARRDSAGVEIRYEYTIRGGLRCFRTVNGQEVEGRLDETGCFVPFE